MGRLILFRAGKTEYDEQNRFSGKLDLPLSIAGTAEATDWADSVKDAGLKTVFCSEEEAAEATAQIIADRIDAPVRPIKGLSNVDLGLWQGMSITDLKKKQPRIYKQWYEAPRHICPPNGETLDAVFERTRAALRPALKKVVGHSVALTASDPLWRVIRGIFTERGYEGFWDDFPETTPTFEIDKPRVERYC